MRLRRYTGTVRHATCDTIRLVDSRVYVAFLAVTPWLMACGDGFEPSQPAGGSGGTAGSGGLAPGGAGPGGSGGVGGSAGHGAQGGVGGSAGHGAQGGGGSGGEGGLSGHHVFLQDGVDNYQGTRVTFLGHWDPGPFGADAVARVRPGNGGVPDFESLIFFDLSIVPVTAAVTNATLHLQITGTNGNALNVGLYDVLVAWNETEATWSNRTAADAWAAAGMASGTDYAPTAFLLTAFDWQNGAAHWVDLDVTTQVQLWVASPTSNNGLLLRDFGANGSVTYSFDSDDAVDQTARPQLEIGYVASG